MLMLGALSFVDDNKISVIRYGRKCSFAVHIAHNRIHMHGTMKSHNMKMKKDGFGKSSCPLRLKHWPMTISDNQTQNWFCFLFCMKIVIDEEIKESEVNSIWKMFNMHSFIFQCIICTQCTPSEFQARTRSQKKGARERKRKRKEIKKNWNATKLRAESSARQRNAWLVIFHHLLHWVRICEIQRKSFMSLMQTKKKEKGETIPKYMKKTKQFPHFHRIFTASVQHCEKVNLILSLSQMVSVCVCVLDTVYWFQRWLSYKKFDLPKISDKMEWTEQKKNLKNGKMSGALKNQTVQRNERQNMKNSNKIMYK